jgi:hemerythrin superfamily protein
MGSNRISKRDMAAVASGVAIGIIGSRLLPPLIASASGSVRAGLGGDVFEQLIQDHRYFLSTLDEMLETPADAIMRRTKQLLMLKRALAKHALAEEDVVYPLLHEELHQVDDSKHLYDEHADIKIHMFELERLLKENADWRDRVAQLRDLIASHARQEEDVEFPRIRQALNETNNKKLSGQIRREEALIV